MRQARSPPISVFGAEEKVRGEPFEAVEIDLAEWWVGQDEDEDG